MKNHPVLLGLLLFSAATVSAAAQDAKTEQANEIVVDVSNIENTDGRIA